MVCNLFSFSFFSPTDLFTFINPFHPQFKCDSLLGGGGDLYIDIKIKLNTSAGKMNANNASLKVF